MRLGIIIITYNISIDVFLLQIESIRKFCRDSFTIEIIDNSYDEDIISKIRHHSNLLGLNYHKTSSVSSNGSESHFSALRESYRLLGNNYDYIVYFDHDLIPIKTFSIVEILGDKMIAGLGQGSNIIYYYTGCLFLRNDKIDNSLVDFSPNHELGIDTGGSLYKIIDRYGKENCIFFNETYCTNIDYRGDGHQFYDMINDMFMHFIAGSGWNKSPTHKERIDSLLKIAKEKILNN